MLSVEKEIITKKAKTCHFQHDICLVSAQFISVLKFNSVRLSHLRDLDFY